MPKTQRAILMERLYWTRVHASRCPKCDAPNQSRYHYCDGCRADRRRLYLTQLQVVVSEAHTSS